MRETTNNFGKKNQGVDANTLRLRERNRILSQKFKLIDNSEDFEEVSSVKQEIELYEELGLSDKPKKSNAINVLKNLMLGFFGGKTADDIEIEAEINDPNALTAKYQSKASIKQAMLIQALKSRQQGLHDQHEHKGKAKKASPLSSTLLASELIAEKALRASQEQKSQDGKSDKLLGAEASLAAKALNGAAGALKNGGSEALLAKSEMAAAMKHAMAPMANAGLGSVVGAAIAAAAMQAHANMASHANIPSSGHGAAHGAHAAHANNAHAHSAAETAKNANAAAKEGNKHTEKTAESAKKDDATINHEKHDKNGIDKNREGFNAYRQEEALAASHNKQNQNNQPENKVENKVADVAKQADPVVKAEPQVAEQRNGRGGGANSSPSLGVSGDEFKAPIPAKREVPNSELTKAPAEDKANRQGVSVNSSPSLGVSGDEFKAPIPAKREVPNSELTKPQEQARQLIDSMQTKVAFLDNGKSSPDSISLGRSNSVSSSRTV